MTQRRFLKAVTGAMTLLAFSCQSTLCFAGRDDDLKELQETQHAIAAATTAMETDTLEGGGEGSGSVTPSAAVAAPFSATVSGVAASDLPAGDVDVAALMRATSSSPFDAGEPSESRASARLGGGGSNLLSELVLALSAGLGATGHPVAGFILGLIFRQVQRTPDLWAQIKDQVEALVNEKIDQQVYDTATRELNGLSMLMIDFNTKLYRLKQGESRSSSERFNLAEQACSQLQDIDSKALSTNPKLYMSGDNYSGNYDDLMKKRERQFVPIVTQHALCYLTVLQSALLYKDLLGLSAAAAQTYQTRLESAIRPLAQGGNRLYSYIAHIEYWYNKEKELSDALPWTNGSAKGKRMGAQAACDTFYNLGAFDYTWAFPYLNPQTYPDGPPSMHTLTRELYYGPVGDCEYVTDQRYKRYGIPVYPIQTLELWLHTTGNPGGGIYMTGYSVEFDPTDGRPSSDIGQLRSGSGSERRKVSLLPPYPSFPTHLKVSVGKLVTQKGVQVRTYRTAQWLQFAAFNSEDAQIADWVPKDKGVNIQDRTDTTFSVPGHILQDIIGESALADSSTNDSVASLMPVFKHATLGLPAPEVDIWGGGEKALSPRFLKDIYVSSLTELSIDELYNIGVQWREAIKSWVCDISVWRPNDFLEDIRSYLEYKMEKDFPYGAESVLPGWRKVREDYWADRVSGFKSLEDEAVVSSQGAGSSGSRVEEVQDSI